MAVKFVIKQFYKNGNYGYFQGKHEGVDLFTTMIVLAEEFNSYEEAVLAIENMQWKGIFQVEKIYLN